VVADAGAGDDQCNIAVLGCGASVLSDLLDAAGVDDAVLDDAE